MPKQNLKRAVREFLQYLASLNRTRGTQPQKAGEG